MFKGGREEGRGVKLHVCRGAGRRGVVLHCVCAGGRGGGAWCHTACAHLQVEMDDQGLPTNNLTLEARSECQRVGSNAETVDAIIDGSGDAAVLKMIKNGIDRVNARATTKSQKVPAQSVCVRMSVCVWVREGVMLPVSQVLRWTVLEGDFSVAGGELSESAHHTASHMVATWLPWCYIPLRCSTDSETET